MHPDGLRAAKAIQTPGTCIFCEEPLGGGRRFLCGAAECEAAYLRAWHKDKRQQHPERYGTAFYRARRQSG